MVSMDKQDKSYLFDAKMDLHPEEETFAEPTIVLPSKDSGRCGCTVCRVTLVIALVLLIAVAFVGGYLVQRAVYKPKKCKVDVTPSRTNTSVKLQDILLEMSPQSIEITLRNLTSEPHYASSERNKKLADDIYDTWKSLGFDAKLVKYNVLLSFPEKGKINGAFLYNGSGAVMYRTADKEKILEPSENSSHVLPPFNAYSATGIAKGDLVFANYGRRDDFEYLLSRGVNCSNKIVIVKYGQVFRGDKVTNAQKYGAKAVLIYNDPKDFAPVSDQDLYPHSWWLPRSGVQRGSILIGTGDPLTPRYPAKDGVFRHNTSEIALPKIPAHPLSAEDAEQFLRLLGGEVAPAEWQGKLNITYNIGPGFAVEYKDWKVKVETNNNHTRKDIYNVIAILKGNMEPDRLVLLGNHRDAWIFGGIDPSSGTACMMEIAKALGKKYKQGWRPRRSIVLCSWGGEEYGLLGSTEWVEDNVHLLYQRSVAYLNVDSPIRGNYSLYVQASPLLHQVLFSASKQVKDPVNQEQSVYDNWLEKFPSANGRNPKIHPLGSGSDYSPFCQRAGVPSSHMNYIFDMYQFYNTSSYPAYHSVHDTFTYVKTFVDPKFTTHLAVAQVWASTAFLLAETPILPINCSDYAVAMEKGALNLQKKYGKQLSDQGISLSYLMSALEKFWSGAREMQSLMQSVNLSNPWSVAQVNDRLIGLEKNFLNPEGLPGRPLYWHSIFAPSLLNSYASATFPGLTDALAAAVTNGNWKLVQEELSDTVVAIEWAAQFLISSV